MPSRARTKLPVVEKYMHSCMANNAHDSEHVYRVLNYAINIMENECETVDSDLLIISCLLHDIGRVEQYDNPNVDHAICGAEKAYKWLINNEYSDRFASSVKECILTHRYRSDNIPKSIEAKILFDADKLDACGAVGIARVLMGKGGTAEPLYSLSNDSNVLDELSDTQHSFLYEYKFKLENLYSRFYTKHGMKLATERKCIAKLFYDSLLTELNGCYMHSL
jgi:uncharacterized protein